MVSGGVETVAGTTVTSNGITRSAGTRRAFVVCSARMVLALRSPGSLGLGDCATSGGSRFLYWIVAASTSST